MQFLFVSSGFRLQLPSDSASRRTPLPSANSSYCQACSGLSPPSYSPCRAHLKNEVCHLRQTSSLQSLYSIKAWQLTSCPACRRPCRPCHPYQVRRQILLEFGLLLLQLLRTLRQLKLHFVVLNE